MVGKVSSQKVQKMLEMPVSRLIPQMAVPTIVAQMITTIYNIVDTFFVSTLGTNATAAVGVNSSLSRAITLTGSLIGAGACSYIARLLGGNQKREADEVLSTSIITGMLIGVFILTFGLLSLGHLVFWLGATGDCAVYAMQYARYILLAAPFMIGSFILNMCLRSEGNAIYAMTGIGFGGILNCFLDPLFIFSFGFGVAGAAMATAISQVVSFVILVVPYFRNKCMVNLSARCFRYRKKAIYEVLTIGSTSFFRSVFAVISGILINRVAGGFSTATLAALSVANRVMEFPFAVILGFGQGFQPVVGFNWGAKQYRRVRKSFAFSSIISIIGGIVIGVVIALLANPVITIFNREADSEVLQIGALCVRLQCLALPIHAWVSIINMFYAGIGRAKAALAVSTARQGYCLIPVLLIAPWFMGVYGVASAQCIADCLTLLVAIPLALMVRKILPLDT